MIILQTYHNGRFGSIWRRITESSNETCGSKQHHNNILQNYQLHALQRKTTNTRLHTFNGPLSGTTQVSRYQKGKTNLDFTEARDSEWQWHQLGRMQVCTSLQTDNHASTLPLKFFTGRMPFLQPNQQCQSTEGTNKKLSLIWERPQNREIFSIWHKLDAVHKMLHCQTAEMRGQKLVNGKWWGRKL